MFSKVAGKVTCALCWPRWNPRDCFYSLMLLTHFFSSLAHFLLSLSQQLSGKFSKGVLSLVAPPSLCLKVLFIKDGCKLLEDSVI